MDRQLDVYRRLLGYLRPYWRQVILAYGAMMAAALLNLFVPQIIKQAIEQGFSSRLQPYLEDDEELMKVYERELRR